jgi:hypothetical protein
MTNFNYKEVDSLDEILACVDDLTSKIQATFVSATRRIKNLNLPLQPIFSEDKHIHLVLQRKPVYTGSSYWFVSHERISLLWCRKKKRKYHGSVDYEIFIQDNKLLFSAYGCSKKVLDELSKIEGFILETPC